MKLNMPVAVQAIQKALFKIFNNDFAFTIPLYPRSYVWTRDQASELLTDLLASAGNGSQPVEEVNPYYLGSIALIKGKGFQEIDIVDGQQRLTALTILLAVLRAAVQSEFAAGLTGFNYEEGELIAGMSSQYRLKLLERDEVFFRQYIQDEKGLDSLLQLDSAQLTDSQKNVQANAKYFTRALANLSESQRVSLLQYLMQRCFLIVVSIPDLDLAYRTFSVLNARGLDLQLGDLVTSQIIRFASREQQEKFVKIWVDEEEETFQELFAHIRMIYRMTILRETALNEYRKHVQPQQSRQQFIDEVLKPYSESFEIIKTATYQSDEGAKAVSSLICWLNRIDNFDWVPSAILYLSQNRYSPDRLIQFFTDLERLASGLMIMRADVNHRIKRYGRLLTAIKEKANLYVADSPLQLTPGETSQIMKTLKGDFYLIKRIRQYVLLRLDSTLMQGKANYDYPIVSVEHVLPQNPGKESIWLKWFPVEEERKQYMHRIGNLALVPRKKSVRAQNYDFDKKKEGYFAAGKGISPFALTTQVLQETEWTPAVIDQRQKVLLHQLKTLWRL